MKLVMALVGGASLLTLAACGQEAAEQTVSAIAAVAAPQEAVKGDTETPEPLSPGEVLRTVYAVDSKDGTSATTDAGAVATFWLGHAFEVGGQSYFTGFTTLTAEPDGAAESSNAMEPGRVAIGQATFLRNADHGSWSNVATDGYVGEFGMLSNPEAIDESRQPVSQAMPDGRLVLAVPVRSFDDGVAYANFAVLVFDPKGPEGQPFRMWTYAGTFNAGSDNAAACEGGVLICAKSEGNLTFEADTNGKLPRIRVERSGNEVSGPGELRTLGPNDATVFIYDESVERYVQ